MIIYSLKILVLLSWIGINIGISIYRKSVTLVHYTSIEIEELQRIRVNKKLYFLLQKSKEILSFLKLLFTLSLIGLGAYVLLLFQELVPSTNVVSLFFILGILGIIGCQYLIFEFLLSKWICVYYERILTKNYWVLWVLYKLGVPIFSLIKKIQSKSQDKTNVEVEISRRLHLAYLLEDLSIDNGLFSKRTKRIALNAIRIRNLDVSDILLPRSQVQYLDIDDSVETNIKLAKAAFHTRFPLCKGDLDHCTGIVHIKDLFYHEGELTNAELLKMQRKLLRIPEHTSVENALERMLHLKAHMAMVIDEFEGTIGLVTLERILEELIGAIQDEFDVEEELPIKQVFKNQFWIAGLATIHDLEFATGIEVSNENVSTFSGLITSKLGRIPRKGEKLVLENMAVEIQEVNEKRIISGLVTILPKLRR